MKFGVNTFIWSDHFDRSQIPLLARIKSAGFSGVELPLIDLDTANDPEIGKAVAAAGLEPTFCSVLPPGLNTVSDDKAVRRKTLEHYQRCIEIAAGLGGHIIAGPLYAPVGYLPGRRRTADEWKYAVECFQALGPALQQHKVTMAIEPLNRYETYFLNTAADAVKLCEEVNQPNVGILFDTYHANIEEKNVRAAIEQCGSHLRHFHSCENDRGVPGTGHTDWPEVFAGLKAISYNGYLTIEGFGFSLGSLSAAASIWRDLAPQPDDIGFEGIQFLRSFTS